MGKGIRIGLAILSALLLLVLVALFILTRGLQEGSQVTIEGIDSVLLRDGDFLGEYAFGRWTHTVSVSVREGRIADITLLEGFSHPQVSNEVFRQIIAAQDTMVDGVVGATVSSKAYMKSVENALLPR